MVHMVVPAAEMEQTRPAHATPRVPKPVVRAVGLTPRLFEALASTPDACIRSLPAKYVKTIGRYVQSVAPSSNVMSKNYVPVIMEDEDGFREVFHVDPLAVQKFQQQIAGELLQVQDKRDRMMRRIRNIRQNLPEATDLVARLRREIADATSRANEPLVSELPPQTQTLHVFVDVSRHMVQLSLVRERLMQELPELVPVAGVRRVSFAALGASRAAARQAEDTSPTNCTGVADVLRVADEWLRNVLAAREAEAALAVVEPNVRSTDAANEAKSPEALEKPSKAATNNGRRRRGISGKAVRSVNIKLAGPLREATTAHVFDESAMGGLSTVLLIVSAAPEGEDLEECVGLVRRSPAVLKVVGVFGTSPTDPEPALQRLVDAAAPGSSLRLFFGPTYWLNFAAARSQLLKRTQQKQSARALAAVSNAEAKDDGSSEMEAAATIAAAAEEERRLWLGEDEHKVVSPQVFEMRLIERIMRECYVDERRCEEDLVCASRVLERKAVDREEIIAALRPHNVLS